MKVYLFLKDGWSYDDIDKDNFGMDILKIDAWTTDEFMYNLRQELFYPKGKIEQVDMNKDCLKKFRENCSDKLIDIYNLDIHGPDEVHTGAENISINIPLTYSEFSDIHEHFYYYTLYHGDMFVPPEIFESKYAYTLEILEMGFFYAERDNYQQYNNSSFVQSGHGNIIDIDNYYDYCPEFNDFSAFMLLHGNFIRKKYFKKYIKMKGLIEDE